MEQKLEVNLERSELTNLLALLSRSIENQTSPTLRKIDEELFDKLSPLFEQKTFKTFTIIAK